MDLLAVVCSDSDPLQVRLSLIQRRIPVVPWCKVGLILGIVLESVLKGASAALFVMLVLWLLLPTPHHWDVSALSLDSLCSGCGHDLRTQSLSWGALLVGLWSRCKHHGCSTVPCRMMHACRWPK